MKKIRLEFQTTGKSKSMNTSVPNNTALVYMKGKKGKNTRRNRNTLTIGNLSSLLTVNDGSSGYKLVRNRRHKYDDGF